MTTILATSTPDMTAFLDLGTQVLGWVIESMTTVLSFLTSHPVTMIGILIALIGVAFGFLFSALHRV